MDFSSNPIYQRLKQSLSGFISSSSDAGHRLLVSIPSSHSTPNFGLLSPLLGLYGASSTTSDRFCIVATRGTLSTLRQRPLGDQALIIPPEDVSTRLLGRTLDGVVIVDAQSQRPSIVAMAAETVRAGGVVVVLSPAPSDAEFGKLTQFDVAKYKSGLFPAPDTSFYGIRFSRITSDFAVTISPTGDVLSAAPAALAPAPAPALAPAPAPASTLAPALLAKCASPCQQAALATTLGAGLPIVALTAARGRGKSAALGLVAASLLHTRQSVVVVAPSLDTVRTLLMFVVEGLDVLGVEQGMVNYDATTGRVSYTYSTLTNSTVHCTFHTPDSYHPSSSSALLIDEAASIPLPTVSAMLSLDAPLRPPLTVLASTVHGYEGTGRALAIKLIDKLTGRPDFSHVTMTTPIRYADNDPCEAWLNRLFLFTSAPACPPVVAPAAATLVKLNKELLFSHGDSEPVLEACHAIMVEGHYRNSPDDLRLLADAPAHDLYALVPAPSRLSPLVVIQVALEGGITEKKWRAGASSNKGGGDIISWTLADNAQNAELAQVAGARIVRIATHPALVSMGYGTRAINLLVQHLSGLLAAPAAPAPALATPVSALPAPALAWVGTSFGLTAELANYWSRAGFACVHLRLDSSDTTGEHSSAWVHPLGAGVEGVVKDARHRFVSLFGGALKGVNPHVVATLCFPPEFTAGKMPTQEITFFTREDVSCLGRFSSDPLVCTHLYPRIVRTVSTTRIPRVGVSRVLAAVLAGLFVQARDPAELGQVLALPTSQVLAQAGTVVAGIYELVKGEKEDLDVLESLSLKAPAALPRTITLPSVRKAEDAVIDKHKVAKKEKKRKMRK